MIRNFLFCISTDGTATKMNAGQMDSLFAKCARRIVPFIALLYLANTIDRVNVGFAALTMNQDMSFSPVVFGFGAGAFSFGYFFFQVPSGVMLSRLGARRWIFLIMLVWGLISASSAFVQGPTSFYTLRILLGAVEAGFTPGMFFYLTLWFPAPYRARYTAGFMAAIPLASVIGGPLSSLILGMEGVAGLHGWQWLFLIEGLPSCLLAFAVLNFLPDGPAKAPWLHESEKRLIATALTQSDTSEHGDLWRALRDYRVIALGIVLIATASTLYGTALWLPQIVQGMGFSNTETGFIVAIPSLAAIPLMFIWARSSDKSGERTWHVVLPMLLTAFSLALVSVVQNYLLVLIALSITVISVLAALAPLNNIPMSLLSGTGAAGGLALYNSIGNLGGFAGPYLLGALKEATGDYASGMATLAAMLVAGALIVWGINHPVARRLISYGRMRE